MVIRKISKKNSKVNSNEANKENIINNKESSQKITLKDITKQREAKEKLEKEKQLKKEAEEKKEKDRQEKLVMEYMDSMHKQVEEKQSWIFWVFPDRSGFKKIKIKLPEDFEKMTTQEPEKYKNRWVANIIMSDLHNITRPTSNRVLYGHMILVTINLSLIDEDGKLARKKPNRFGCIISWEVEDFKVSKISFKLIERIMYAMLETRKSCYFMTGYPFRALIKGFEKKGYDFSDVLNPLAGL